MLTEERYAAILRLLDERKAATVQELTELLNTSESTIRRDLNALHNLGRLNKVHGGATSIVSGYATKEDDVTVKYQLNAQEKQAIARHAASLLRPNDFVFLDAGTTTEQMIDFIAEMSAVFVTDGIFLAKKLAKRGLTVFVPAGRIKAATEAVVGSETIDSLSRYNFTVGFFGTNGIAVREGFTTPDVDEARVKSEAMARCRRKIMLADASKFGLVSSVSFAKLSDAEIITNQLPDAQYRKHTKITEADPIDLHRNL